MNLKGIGLPTVTYIVLNHSVHVSCVWEGISTMVLQNPDPKQILGDHANMGLVAGIERLFSRASPRSLLSSIVDIPSDYQTFRYFKMSKSTVRGISKHYRYLAHVNFFSNNDFVHPIFIILTKCLESNVFWVYKPLQPMGLLDGC